MGKGGIIPAQAETISTQSGWYSHGLKKKTPSNPHLLNFTSRLQKGIRRLRLLSFYQVSSSSVWEKSILRGELHEPTRMCQTQERVTLNPFTNLNQLHTPKGPRLHFSLNGFTVCECWISLNGLTFSS